MLHHRVRAVEGKAKEDQLKNDKFGLEDSVTEMGQPVLAEIIPCMSLLHAYRPPLDRMPQA
jgi:hypothetical protein